GTHRLDSERDITMAGEQDDRQERALQPRRLQQPEPVEAGHAHVGNHGLERLAIEPGERLGPALRRNDRNAAERQPFAGRAAQLGFIVDDKDRTPAHSAASRTGTASGRETVKVAPSPSAVSKTRAPPNSLMSAREMDRPRPSPSPVILVV